MTHLSKGDPAWSLITCLSSCLHSPLNDLTMSLPLLTADCYSGLMRANERKPPPPLHFPSWSPHAQPKQRPVVGLIINRNGQGSDLSVQTCGNGVGRERENGSRGDEVSINVSQRRLFGLQIIAGWCSIILQPKIAVERKVEWRKKKDFGGGGGGFWMGA